MGSRRYWYGLLGLSAAVLLYLWATPWPLGVPGEWEWDRVRGPVVQWIPGWFLMGGVAAAYLAVVWSGLHWGMDGLKRNVALWLAGLSLAGFAWLGAVQEFAAPPNCLGKAAWVLYFPGSSGYFTIARSETDDVTEFLRSYENRMEQGDVLHVGTHPPGLFLLYHVALDVCERFPSVRAWVHRLEPGSYRESCQVIRETARPGRVVLTSSDRAVLWLVALLTQAAAVATVFPLYGVMRLSVGRPAAWMAVAFWPLVPALAVFLPKSDALYPLLAMALLWSWVEGLRRRSVWLGMTAGFLAWLGLFFSLALLPALILAGLIVVCEGWSARMREESFWPNVAWLCAVALLGFAVPTILFWLTAELNLLRVWWLNYHNHAAFYAQYTRTYWKWLLVNPLELLWGAGAPLVVLAGVGLGRAIAADRRGGTRGSACEAVLAAAVWGLLWLSGKNMGEAARLWIVVMPWLAWLAAFAFDTPRAAPNSALEQDAREPTRHSRARTWIFALVVQMVVCVGTVSRIDGFGLVRLTELTGP